MSSVKKMLGRVGTKSWFAKSDTGSNAPKASGGRWPRIDPKDYEWGRVFLWDIEPSVTPEEIVEFVRQHGLQAVACGIKESRAIGDESPIVVIEFATKQEAERAARWLNQRLLRGKKVSVSEDLTPYLKEIKDPQALADYHEWYSV